MPLMSFTAFSRQVLCRVIAVLAFLLFALAAFVVPVFVVPGAAQVQAQTNEGEPHGRHTDALLDLLAIEQIVDILRAEGLVYSSELARDMLPGGGGKIWGAAVEKIYDRKRMVETVRSSFEEDFTSRDMNTDRLERFFSSETGRQIVNLEVTARAAMADQAIEDTARAHYREHADRDTDMADRLTQLDQFIEANDLIETNVVGGLNTTIKFYQGLADGGAIKMSEAEILAEVWGSEDDTRSDTREWLYGFLLMAYRPLQDSALADYADLSASPEGKAMNRALFVGFDKMYGDISYALGRAIAQQIGVQEL